MNDTSPESYPHTMTPFAHQREELINHWETPNRMIAWEQGLGKMKCGYDWAMQLRRAGKRINTLIVVAPPGVHRDWIEEGFHAETPLVPPQWHPHIRYHWHNSERAHTKKHQKQLQELAAYPGMVVFTIAYPSVVTEPNKRSGWIGGKAYLRQLLLNRRCAMALDESAHVQTLEAAVTRCLVGRVGQPGLSQYALYKRLFDGTPADEGPFNLFPQFMFLDNRFWVDRGIGDYSCFKTQYAVIHKQPIFKGRKKTGDYDLVKSYRNLPHLNKLIAPLTDRRQKDECLDLPPKIYQHLGFDLSNEQREKYDEIKDELMTEVYDAETGTEGLAIADLPIVKFLRLYQITCGYLPFEVGDEDEEKDSSRHAHMFKDNPRLETGLEYLRTKSGKVVVWCRYIRDVDMLCSSLGKSAVRYDGTLTQEERRNNKQEWLHGDTQYLVPQINAMATGHNLNIAGDVLYYNNSTRLRLRRQSEDRTHRGVMKGFDSIRYMDLTAFDTLDAQFVHRLKQKLDVAQTIMGDK